jgi:hypothetical protein
MYRYNSDPSVKSFSRVYGFLVMHITEEQIIPFNYISICQLVWIYSSIKHTKRYIGKKQTALLRLKILAFQEVYLINQSIQLINNIYSRTYIVYTPLQIN